MHSGPEQTILILRSFYSIKCKLFLYFHSTKIAAIDHIISIWNIFVFSDVSHLCLVAWPSNESVAGVDLVLIETSLLFLC